MKTNDSRWFIVFTPRKNHQKHATEYTCTKTKVSSRYTIYKHSNLATDPKYGGSFPLTCFCFTRHHCFYITSLIFSKIRRESPSSLVQTCLITLACRTNVLHLEQYIKILSRTLWWTNLLNLVDVSFCFLFVTDRK